MIFAWTLIILAVLSAVLILAILNFRANDIESREQIFIEALWRRRAKIPLLLEVIKRSNGNIDINRAQFIDLRSKLQSESYTIPEQQYQEKELTRLIAHAFQATEFDPGCKQDSAYLALNKEFNLLLEDIRRAVNDYNYSIQKFKDTAKPVPLNFFAFLFKVSRKKEVELV